MIKYGEGMELMANGKKLMVTSNKLQLELMEGFGESIQVTKYGLDMESMGNGKKLMVT